MTEAVNQLGMFAKYWQPGAVKTRLANRVGIQAASDLYREFVRCLAARFRHCGHRRVLAYWPAERSGEFFSLAGANWSCVPQSAGDLGVRMHRFFTDSFAAGATRVVLIGSDSPTLPVAYVELAFDLLETHTVVLGPARDGGYYLLGMTSAESDIFHNIAWSTPLVWRQTVTRLEAAGTSFAQLPEWYDVDDLDDLRQLRDELHEQSADPTWQRLLERVGQAVSDHDG